VVLIVFAIVLLSWDHLNDSKTRLKQFPVSGAYHNLDLMNDEDLAFHSEMDDEFLTDSNKAPAAEDVLIQRIPGDDNHVLLMAYYSKENYSEQSLTLKDGSGIVFRDDGKDFDKKAGDGIYTARISADVNEFRKQALSMREQMSKSNYKPFRYVHRAMIYDPDAAESFDAQQFDANQAVSVSGLTNALSTDLSTAATTKPTTIDSIRQNSILITNLKVVEDPSRTWNSCSQVGNIKGPSTFGTLMRQLASKSPTSIATDAALSTFVKNWLNIWATNQIINGDTVKARTLVNSVLTPWLSESQNSGSPVGQLDMRFAPFKLMAIVNRFDLRNDTRPCGEGRFVFCLIKSDCSRALQMTVIFEYGINKPIDCNTEKSWAQQWINLKNFTLGSSAYNQALKNITDQFTLCGTNPNKTNQSSLDQIRTNDVTLSPNPKIWELREFVLDGTSGGLKETTVGQNPADRYDAQVVNANVQRMADYVNKNTKAIVSETNVVPLAWNGVPFLGGSAHILDSPTGSPPKVYHWDGTKSTSASTFITSDNARFFYSFNTCSGCHAGETQTHFTHVDPVFFGTEATLSGFLTGKAGFLATDFDHIANNDTMAVKDAALRPSTNPAIRNFNDIKRRAQDLKKVTSTTCGSVLSISSQLMFQPLNSED